MRDIFQKIYDENFWQDEQSVSGPGSNLEVTKALRQKLPPLFEQLGITSILDIPCGDFLWFNEMHWARDEKEFHRYIGGDIVPAIIAENKKRFGTRTYLDFQVLDATKDKLPKVDLILCRDMLVHFSYKDIAAALKNFRASGSKYLLATTFPGVGDFGIETGQWHAMDLSRIRYGLGQPELLINEESLPDSHIFSMKSLGLWRLN